MRRPSAALPAQQPYPALERHVAHSQPGPWRQRDLLRRLGGATGLTLNKAGAGAETLSGTNTYSGGTNVNGGTLVAITAASLPNYTVAVAGGATLTVPTGDGATDGWTSAQIVSLLTSASWANNTAVLEIVTTNANLTYGGNITQALALTKAGAGTLTLTGANTYTGPTTVAAGVFN